MDWMPFYHAVALFCAGLFAGGAMMQSIVDHPARMAADPRTGLDQMQRTLRRADPYMPALAIIGSAAALLSFTARGWTNEVAAGTVLLAVVPFTVAFIVPVSRAIHRHRPEDFHGEKVAYLLRRWGWLHAVRSGLGVLSFGLLTATGSGAL